MWDWPAVPADQPIGPGEVHVWAAGLVLLPQQLSELEDFLDLSEHDRAALFVQPVHRDRFIAAHGMLRRLLGRCLKVDPREICFVSGPQGKPALSPTMPGHLQFNLAHSGEAALIAIARGRDVGVDVEQVRAMPDTEAIAARFFSADEQAALAALPAAERTAAFFNIWTRKEAWIKAIGQGLSYPLDQFSVSLGQGEEDCLLSASGDPAIASQWRLCALVAPLGYAAAVAAEGRDWSLLLWRL